MFIVYQGNKLDLVEVEKVKEALIADFLKGMLTKIYMSNKIEKEKVLQKHPDHYSDSEENKFEDFTQSKLSLLRSKQKYHATLVYYCFLLFNVFIVFPTQILKGNKLDLVKVEKIF